MHHCLNIVEIVGIICSHLENEPRSLTVLARTSRMFEDPALDILWKSLNTLVPLLNCLPSDAVDTSGVSEAAYEAHRETRAEGLDSNDDSNADHPWKMRLLRPLVRTDWDRPRFYASRVKFLAFADYEGSVAFDILTALDNSSPGPLLPHLTNFRWCNNDSTDFHLVRNLLAPSITTLRLSFMPSSATLTSLSILSDACPQLEHLSISDLGPSSDADRAISAFILKLDRIKSFDTMNIPDSVALAHLGQLDTLTGLSLKDLPPILPQILPGTRPMFQRLHRLSLGYLDAGSVTRFLRLCDTDTPLKQVIFSCYPTATARELTDLLHAVSQCSSPQSLTELLIFNDSDSDDPPDDDYTLSPHAFRSLLDFANLTSLLLMVPNGYFLDDGTVLQMARAWPRIEQLRLKSSSDPCHSCPTMLSLHHLSQHCTHLTRLDLTFDTTVVPAMPAAEAVPQQCLVLNVQHSPITADAVAAVARYLFAIFPAMLTTDQPEMSVWAEVDSYLWRLQRETYFSLRELVSNHDNASEPTEPTDGES
ncbi:hypothetical protein C8R43DRAFT_1131531 [Mycena crocata]|nr:hypothetical protein C8R43DRAFT_1131531 [Mycena crocata]